MAFQYNVSGRNNVARLHGPGEGSHQGLAQLVPLWMPLFFSISEQQKLQFCQNASIQDAFIQWISILFWTFLLPKARNRPHEMTAFAFKPCIITPALLLIKLSFNFTLSHTDKSNTLLPILLRQRRINADGNHSLIHLVASSLLIGYARLKSIVESRGRRYQISLVRIVD